VQRLFKNPYRVGVLSPAFVAFAPIVVQGRQVEVEIGGDASRLGFVTQDPQARTAPLPQSGIGLFPLGVLRRSFSICSSLSSASIRRTASPNIAWSSTISTTTRSLALASMAFRLSQSRP
jgi:hypothetical protein